MDKRFWLLLGAAIIFMGVTCKTSQQSQAMVKVMSHKEDARLQARVDSDGVIIEIFSASGIGQADFELVSEQMPKRIELRFHLRGLEELRFAYDEIIVTSSLSSTGEQGIRQSLSRAGEKPIEAQTITANSPYWMKLRVVSQSKIPLQDGYIEVEAPEHFLKNGTRKASIQWIDFYR
jgi:hypothetical protein